MVLNNKRGQTIFFALMLGICIIVVALGIVPVIKSFVDDARAPTSDTAVGLDCDNETISDYNKSQCVVVDMTTPYFFLGLIGIALLVIGAKAIIT
jgi:hypothetical protein